MALTRYGIKEPVKELLDGNVKQGNRENHDILVFVSEKINFMARQGLALRGDSHSGSSTANPNSNTHQLLQFYCKISGRTRCTAVLQFKTRYWVYKRKSSPVN